MGAIMIIAGRNAVDDVRDALQELMARSDLKTARNLLQRFDAKKASEVSHEKIAEFVVAAKAKGDAAAALYVGKGAL
jgi:hypothetical protein